MKVKLDFDSLSVGDLLDFEEKTGANLIETTTQMEKTGQAPMKALVGLLWICRRSEDPSYSYEDARKMKITELAEIEFEVVGSDPTGGDGSKS